MGSEMQTLLGIVRIVIDIIRDSPSILVNILGGIIFAKLVYKNMMKSSRKSIAGNDNFDDGIKSQSVSTKELFIKEITNQDTILPASTVSLNSYKNIFKVIKLRFILMAGGMVFPFLFFIPVGSGKPYYVLLVSGLFIIFIAGLIIIYIKHVHTLKKISEPLVVLRVFGSKSNTQFLFNQVVSLWNYLGATFTIMDPVYARSEFTLFNSPKNFKLKLMLIGSFIPGALLVEFYSFGNVWYNLTFIIISQLVIFMILLVLLTGSFFIKDIKTLLKKINKDSNFLKTWNGIGKQINLYCFDNIWKKALREMLGKANFVLMDLRGFSSERRGCSFEISHLVNNFDLDKVLFLINQKTDKNLVLETLRLETDKIKSSSPNADKEKLNITIYSCEKQNRKDTQKILQILCNQMSLNTENLHEEPKLSYSTSIPLIKIPYLLLLFIMIFAVLFNLTFSSYGISFFEQMKSYEQAQDITAAPPPEPLASYELPSFSKATADMEPHFIKITIAVGYEKSPELESELEIRNIEIEHAINILLQGKTYKELDTIEDQVTLAEEIKAHINIILMTGKIKEVYFKEFILN